MYHYYDDGVHMGGTHLIPPPNGEVPQCRHGPCQGVHVGGVQQWHQHLQPSILYYLTLVGHCRGTVCVLMEVHTISCTCTCGNK